MLESEIRAKIAYVNAGNVIEANRQSSKPTFSRLSQTVIFTDSQTNADELGGITLREMTMIDRNLVFELFEVTFERRRLIRSQQLDHVKATL